MGAILGLGQRGGIPLQQPLSVRFGVFELDPRNRELRKHGVRIKLQDQPFRVLEALVERPGELVTREELRARIWGDTFTDVDQGLNHAVRKVREALSDPAENPRFIATHQKLGYRFIAPVGQAPTPPPAEAPAGGRFARARKNHAWVFAAAILAAAAAAPVWRFLGPGTSANWRPIPFTALPGQASSPSFSPDGERVAFAWNGQQQDNYDIYVKQIGTNALVRLTRDPDPDTTPAWSPDGRHIAFRRSGRSRATSILLMPSIGGPERKLKDLFEARGPLSWDAGGEWLAFAGRNSPEEQTAIWMIQTETLEMTRLTQPPPGAADVSPAISPDGARLAFGRKTAEFVVRPYVVHLSPDGKPTGEPRAVSREIDFAAVYGQQTIPDGGIAWVNSREFIYSGGGAQARRLWRAHISGDRPRVGLSFAVESAQSPAVSIGKRRLLYEWYQSNVNLWRIDPRKGAFEALIVSRGEQRLPQYSPDGRRIAFQSSRSGAWEVWTCHADGSNCLQLTFFGGPQTGTPRWSPDGQWLVFDTRVDGTSQLFVISSDGGAPRRLTSGVAASRTAFWSRNGRRIYFLSNRAGRDDVWQIDPRGGDPEQVTHTADDSLSSGGMGTRPAEGPDGKSVYYVKSNSMAGPLFEWRLDGSGERQVLPAVATPASWWATEKGIYYVAPDAPLTLRIYEFGNRKSRPIAELRMPLNGGLCVSPDDAFVLVTQTDHRSSDLMLVENFR